MTVQTSYPGVYVQEVPSGVRTIAGVSTSVAAFVGVAKRGPINKATKIFSFSDFERYFGGLFIDSEMSYSVKQFFLNGGTQAIIVRVVNNTATSATSTIGGQIKIDSLEPGGIGNSIFIILEHETTTTDLFNLKIRHTPTSNPKEDINEVFSNLSMDILSKNFVENRVNGLSDLIKVTKIGASNNRPTEAPALKPTLTSGSLAAVLPSIVVSTDYLFNISIGGDFAMPVTLNFNPVPATLGTIATQLETKVRALKPASDAYKNFTCVANGANRLVLTSGSRSFDPIIVTIAAPSPNDAATLLKLTTDNVTVADRATAVVPKQNLASGTGDVTFTDIQALNIYIGSQLNREGIYALDGVDIFNILCLPGIVNPSILASSVKYCNDRRAFMIIDPVSTSTSPSQMEILINGIDLPKDDHAAVYYPWIKISDPINNGNLKSVAPCGTMAGIYARTDATRGVWKAPAGTEAGLIGVRGLDYTLTDRENGLLNPLGVNCLRIFPDSGVTSWGGRTLRGADSLASEYKYIPIRRTALFIEESLYRGLKWVVFEPNDEPLWAQIRLNVGAFMHNLFRQGAFQGTTKQQAYFVKCDYETTTQNDINLGVVNIWVGFAPLKPAEFVVLYLQQMTGQIQV